MRRRDRVLVVVAWLAFVVMAAIYGLGVAADPGSAGHRHMAQTKPATPAPKAPAPKVAASPAKVAKKSPAAEYTPTVRFRLRTELADGKMAFVGVGGAIEGVVNPPLRVAEGDVVQVTLINNDNVEHDVVFPEFDAGTDKVARKGASSVTVFRADKSGEFPYFCSLPGHRQAGMESLFTQGLLSNVPLLGAVALTVVLQLVVIYVPVLNPVFKTEPLPFGELALAVGLSSVIFFAVEAEKRVRRSRYGAVGRRASP